MVSNSKAIKIRLSSTYNLKMLYLYHTVSGLEYPISKEESYRSLVHSNQLLQGYSLPRLFKCMTLSIIQLCSLQYVHPNETSTITSMTIIFALGQNLLNSISYVHIVSYTAGIYCGLWYTCTYTGIHTWVYDSESVDSISFCTPPDYRMTH